MASNWVLSNYATITTFRKQKPTSNVVILERWEAWAILGLQVHTISTDDKYGFTTYGDGDLRFTDKEKWSTRDNCYVQEESSIHTRPLICNCLWVGNTMRTYRHSMEDFRDTFPKKDNEKD
jgi:hypothetical protein